MLAIIKTREQEESHKYQPTTVSGSVARMRTVHIKPRTGMLTPLSFIIAKSWKETIAMSLDVWVIK